MMKQGKIDALKNAFDSLKGIEKSGTPGIDSNVERAMISVKLALFNLGAEETIGMNDQEGGSNV